MYPILSVTELVLYTGIRWLKHFSDCETQYTACKISPPIIVRNHCTSMFINTQLAYMTAGRARIAPLLKCLLSCRPLSCWISLLLLFNKNVFKHSIPLHNTVLTCICYVYLEVSVVIILCKKRAVTLEVILISNYHLYSIPRLRYQYYSIDLIIP